MDSYYDPDNAHASYAPNSNAGDYLSGLALYYSSIEPAVPEKTPENRRRSLSDSQLPMPGIYAAYLEFQKTPKAQRRSSIRRSIQHRSMEGDIPVTYAPALQIENPAQLSPEQITTSIRYGLWNLWRAALQPEPQRSEAISQTIRLNMARIYFKYMIQALLYLLIGALCALVLFWCFKAPMVALIPLVIIFALHLAAQEMHQSDNLLHEPDAHLRHSLGQHQNWSTKIHNYIDYAANSAVSFFSPITNKIANSKTFDKQITWIPDNSSTSRIR